jgi:hypothetical protein
MKSKGIGLLCGLVIALCLGSSAQAEASSRIIFARGTGLEAVSPTGGNLGGIKHFGSLAALSATDDGRFVAGLQDPVGLEAQRCEYSADVHAAGERGSQLVEVGVGTCEIDIAPSLAISPNGRLLAFSAGPSIRLLDVATQRRRTLRTPPGLNFQPSFTRDGRHLVFVHSDGPMFRLHNSDIYEIGVDGSSAHRLTESPGEAELFPELSPDGSHLAFLRRSKHGVELVVQRVGSDQEVLIRRVECPFSRPDFSPDGSEIVYAWGKREVVCSLAPRTTIFTVGIDGRGTRAVARDIPTEEFPLLPQWTRVPPP